MDTGPTARPLDISWVCSPHVRLTITKSPLSKLLDSSAMAAKDTAVEAETCTSKNSPDKQ